MKGTKEERLRELFDACLELDPPNRSSFLEDACVDSPEIAAEVRGLVLAAEAFGSGRLSSDQTAPDEEDPLLGRVLNEFEVLSLLGRGGMGSVYLARQLSTERKVALKVLHSFLHASRVQHRFEQEARVLGSLEHPNIARLYGVGQADLAGLHVRYIAMEWVRDGQSIVAHANDHDLDRAARLRLFAQACHTVEHAHQWGIVHRDLKPANTLVDGEGQVKVIDFGIAHSLEKGTGITASGDVLGTPAYMSPEQLHGSTNDVGPRSDVYALGVILYELLTGELPYACRGDSAATMARRVSTSDPTPPCQHDPELRGDLEILILRALERDPALRLSSAGLFAAEIERYLQGKPIEARRDNALYVFRKRMVRHRMALIVGGVLFATMAAATVISLSLWFEAVAAREQSEWSRYVGQIALAGEARKDSRTGELRAILADCEVRHRGWEWQHLWARSDESILSFKAGENHVRVEVSEDGRRIATYGLDQTLRAWDADTGELLVEMPGHTNLIDQAHFVDEEGARILSSSRDHTARLFDAVGGKELKSFPHEDQLFSLALHHDREHFFTGDDSGVLRLWHLDGTEPIFRVDAHREEILSIALSPSGALLATGAADGTNGVWDAETGELVRWLQLGPWAGAGLQRSGSHGKPARVEFLDDDRLLTAGEDGHVRLWDVRTGVLIDSKDHGSRLLGARLDPSGELTAIASIDSVRVARNAEGSVMRPFLGHPMSVVSVDWYPDARRIASGCHDGFVRVFDIQSRGGFQVLERGGAYLEDACVSEDGKVLATIRSNGRVRLWNTSRLDEPIEILVDHEGRPPEIALSPAGDMLAATPYRGGRLRVYALPGGEQLAEYPLGEAYVSWSRSGLWYVGPGGMLTRTALDRHTRAEFDTGVEQPSAIATCGEWVVMGDTDGGVRLFDTQGNLHWQGSFPGSVWCLSFSDDGEVIGAGGNRWVASLRVQDGEEVFQSETIGNVIGLDFSEDATRLFIQHMRYRAQMLLADSGQALLELDQEGTTAIHKALVVLPGDRVVTADSEGQVTVWSR